MPKVFFIGDFRQDYSTEVYIAYGLEKLGVEVQRWQENQPAQLDYVMKSIKDFEPDFVLCSKNRLYSNGHILIQKLRTLGVKTVSWLFDLYVGLPPEMGSVRTLRDSPFFCDFVLMSDGGTHKELSHVNKLTLRQGIHEPEAKLGRPNNRKFDVAFIGSNTYAKRQALLYFLKKTYGEQFVHIGIGGNAPEIRGMELNNALASIKVIIGDSVPSDNYWSNRIYEILGRGGFLLHPKVNGLEKEFEYYKHFVPFEYGNFEQIKKITDHFLANDSDREKIRLAGHKFCKENYTYTKRCKQLLEYVL